MNYDIPALKPISSIVIKLEENPLWKATTQTNTPLAIEHKVVKGDTLTSISELHSVPVQRIWEKNLELTSPDLIEPDMVLKIPDATEVLPTRELPATIQVTAPTPALKPSGFSSLGNTYTKGYCTYLVKQLRPDLPNNLGNASSWLTNASRQGLAVGDTPRTGAVAVTKAYSHVALVIAVHDSTVTVREQNYIGWNKVSTRTAPISEFRYIY